MLSTNWARELLPTPPWETIHIDIPRLVRHEFTCASREPSLTALSSSLKPWIALIMQRTETSHLIIDKFSKLNYPAHSKTEAAPLPLLSFHSPTVDLPAANLQHLWERRWRSVESRWGRRNCLGIFEQMISDLLVVLDQFRLLIQDRNCLVSVRCWMLFSFQPSGLVVR